MSAMASQITSLTIVYSNVYSGTDGRKHQSSTSLAFMRGIHRWLVNSQHKGPVMQKMFPYNDVIMVRVAIIVNIQRWWSWVIKHLVHMLGHVASVAIIGFTRQVPHI